VYKVTVDNVSNVHSFDLTFGLGRVEARPEAMEFLGADEVVFTSVSLPWTRDILVTLKVEYREAGHARRAEHGLKQLAKLRMSGADLSFIVNVVAAEAHRLETLGAAKEAADKLRLIAAGIVTEANRRARTDIDFEAKMTRLRLECERWTENYSVDMVSHVSREQGFDESELKTAVEERLAAPSFEYYLGRV